MLSLKEKFEFGFHITFIVASIAHVLMGQYDVATYCLAILIYAQD